MPIVSSNYNPPLLFRNSHFSTVYSGLVRKVNGVHQKRERIHLSDGDFLDLDWSYAHKPTDQAVILLHGLEGNAQRAYITGSAKQLNNHGYAVCAINFRSCSGETNTLFRSYHSGASEDLDAVISHILASKKYNQIFLKGFSLGGNLVLKYLGEGRIIPKEIKGALAVSVPCNLHSSLKQLLQPINYLYAKRFRNHLKTKMREKQHLFPSKITNQDIKDVKTLKDFDDIYTSRAHGFKDALDYYKKCSSLQFLPHIKVPSLIINALNDTFLGTECYPYREAIENKSLYLETPKYGGHVGFYGTQNITYTEKRVIKFLNEV
ncbi:MAG: alpha/beta fold hydrolase [Maribacter sp.]|nr:alpha/beta fold hydrolase [Maribacter sp.]